ncbi:probable pectinesterase 48 [Malus sylvestris]|uniref:probable pectinesterase 48 n=1 Tax=Malus sylvestris TaxID=3752 RepID=UPI0021AC7CAC|nr:probable pectinesterase 48 [Malus sylvestris]XP_050145338.1 probable pectinesterase 48 [Malus sylvestris]XP_050145339.1 probable pectinesterase 48 [Malus sylvestris]XP_050145340.1 probable pectinesterase 48 [Malus sylvestris]
MFRKQAVTHLGRAWRGRPHMVYAYTNMTKVVSPAGWSDDNHPECNNNVACEEYKRMGPGSRTYNERNLSKELTNKQVKFFISLGYIQEEEELRLKYLQFVQEDAHAAVCFTNLYC